MYNFFSYFSRKHNDVPASIYDFRITAIDGRVIDFSSFKGKKILIVNTATMCGHAGQLGELETLYKQYSGKLEVIAFPSNNFLFQEPRSNKQIATHCSLQYHNTYRMAAKVSVRGFSKAPLYIWLTQKKYNGHSDNRVSWNFQKYLINEEGKLTDIFSPKMSPLDPQIIEAINR